MLKMSRTALYELVWSRPMTEIAREFGIRDQHVAQACDYHDIARPRAGHWQKVNHGKAVERVTLSNDTFSPDDIVIIDSAGWEIAPALQDTAHETARRPSAP
ncbi:MAG: hypothetical protein EOR78_29245 [Mesorhizobium sp.]|uniref:hypothetical protein n=1 Tax=Mesorhizobium sp. TaxID=1871066 RepID=UPI000FE7E888|nr:hypothetical protein [Mesorhizobium sp.]RWH78020.1 MAG: hypothetical protein EOQ85_16925 [Mesorhizobium sp.]RWM48339.1 MAG: hypothetical protein EOR78_29245 [Mesorhizobium sp.]